MGHEPDSVDIEAIPAMLDALRAERRLQLPGGPAIGFDEKTDLIFKRRETLPFHANGMRFTAFDGDGGELQSRTFYSVGGGFVVSDEIAHDGSKQKAIVPDTTVLPHPFDSGDELLAATRAHNCSIAADHAPQ